MNPVRRSSLIIACLAMTLGTNCGFAQQLTPAKQQAINAVLRLYRINPMVRDPRTRRPLAGDGRWSLSATSPASCEKAQQRCAEVDYQVPGEQVKCSWILLFSRNGSDLTILDENDDAARYTLRLVAPNEAPPLIAYRQDAMYPALAAAARVSGTVTVNAVVDPSGKIKEVAVAGAPPMLRGAAWEAARAWRFKPLMVGSHFVSYALSLVFTFHTQGPGDSSVTVIP